jgi:hypothetical protein
VDETGRACSTNGGEQEYIYIYIYIYTHMLTLGKPEAKISLGRPRRREIDNIKLDLGRDIEWGGGGY